MVCPDCLGNKHIEIGISGKMICPTCEGMGFVEKPTGNNCPACGEPISLDEKWCDFHKSAEVAEN